MNGTIFLRESYKIVIHQFKVASDLSKALNGMINGYYPLLLS